VGSQIAYLAPYTGGINVVNADGTGNRTVTQLGSSYNEEQMAWSPDGQLLLATASNGYLELIDVQTGASIALSFSQEMHAPDWK
jgi:Tol biopolymer transport system component